MRKRLNPTTPEKKGEKLAAPTREKKKNMYTGTREEKITSFTEKKPIVTLSKKEGEKKGPCVLQGSEGKKRKGLLSRGHLCSPHSQENDTGFIITEKRKKRESPFSAHEKKKRQVIPYSLRGEEEFSGEKRRGKKDHDEFPLLP